MAPRPYHNHFNSGRQSGGRNAGPKGPKIYAVSSGTLKGVHYVSPSCAPTLPAGHHHPLTLHLQPIDFFALHNSHSLSKDSPDSRSQMRRFASIEAAEKWLDSEDSFDTEIDQVVSSLGDQLRLEPASTGVRRINDKKTSSTMEDAIVDEITRLCLDGNEDRNNMKVEAKESKVIQRHITLPASPDISPRKLPTVVTPPSPPPSPPLISRRASDPSYASLPSSIFTSLDTTHASPLSHAELLEGMIFSIRRRGVTRPSFQQMRSNSQMAMVATRRRNYAEVRRSSNNLLSSLSFGQASGRVTKIGSGRKWNSLEAERRRVMEIEVRKACASGGTVTNKRVVEVIDDGTDGDEKGGVLEFASRLSSPPALATARYEGVDDVDMMDGIE